MARARKERFELNPNETARENLWRAAMNASGVILSRKKLRLNEDEWEELRMLIALRGVRHFMEHKIGMHKYNRKFPFYDNVYSSCWGSSPLVVDKYLKSNREKLSLRSSDKLNSTNCFTYISNEVDTGTHPLDYVRPGEDPEWRENTEKRLENAKKKLVDTHNKRAYLDSVRRLEELLKEDEELTRMELRVECGLDPL